MNCPSLERYKVDYSNSTTLHTYVTIVTLSVKPRLKSLGNILRKRGKGEKVKKKEDLFLSFFKIIFITL